MPVARVASELAITGGTLVTPDGAVSGDVLVCDGRIAAIGPAAGRDAAATIDASGCLVLPGGVDPHAHALTDLEAVSRSAAHGGTTTILTFTLPHDGEPPLEAFLRARDELVPTALVDVGLHSSYFEPGRVPRELLVALREAGVLGLQVFLAFPELGLMFSDGELYDLLRGATAEGLLVQAQCENGSLVDALTAELVAAGETSVRSYPRSRTGAVEDEAVARVLAIAALAQAPTYLVHLSTAIALELARTALAQGTPTIVEVCTHHLLLDERRYEGADAERFVVGPPLRPATDVEAAWRAVADGTVGTVGSDHSQLPEPAIVTGTPFGELSMGLPGMQLRLPLLLSEGLRRGVPIERLVDVLCAGPARAFGLYPRKGAIAVGADADLVVWDPAAGGEVRGADLRDGLGWSPYEGMQITGGVRDTVLGGRVLVRDGVLAREPGSGRFVRC
jgi:dihydropyrimidinase